MPPTSKNSFPAIKPESCFESLWEQRHCLPSSEDASFYLVMLFLISPQEIPDEDQPQNGHDPDIHIEQKLLR